MQVRFEGRDADEAVACVALEQHREAFQPLAREFPSERGAWRRLALLAPDQPHPGHVRIEPAFDRMLLEPHHAIRRNGDVDSAEQLG